MGISHGEFARRVGVSRQAVSKRVKAGRLSSLPDGTLDPAVAAREWNATREPETPPPRPTPTPRPAPAATHAPSAAPGTYAQAKTADSVYKAKLRQLEYEIKSGAFVRAEDVKGRWFELAQTVRTRLMSLPQRLAAELAATTDVHAVRLRLDEEIRTALQELAADARRSAS